MQVSARVDKHLPELKIEYTLVSCVFPILSMFFKSARVPFFALRKASSVNSWTAADFSGGAIVEDGQAGERIR